jgi:hypothetical protein
MESGIGSLEHIQDIEKQLEGEKNDTESDFIQIALQIMM